MHDDHLGNLVATLVLIKRNVSVLGPVTPSRRVVTLGSRHHLLAVIVVIVVMGMMKKRRACPFVDVTLEVAGPSHFGATAVSKALVTALAESPSATRLCNTDGEVFPHL